MVTVRTAQPTTADASAFAELAEIATGHLLSAVVGPRGRTMLESMFLLDRNDYHPSHVRFVEVEGRIAGMVCGFSELDARSNNLRTSLLHLRFISWHLPAVIMRCWPLRHLLAFVSYPQEGHFYAPYLAVHEEFRGRGLSLLLLRAAEEMARLKGCTILSLSADPANAIAMNAYLKFGMINTGHSASGHFRGRQETLLRLEKPLT